ncbi:PaREP1 family protein [Vulcanisaeta distributa]|uniref:PaREP1 family protein n=1 Tax=Vulcanisaeta distributa (strain DSM 14429 / JCM 11212 / NBRC 100878 / IC-017) TaxID=572478 RepID=E1QSL7_VULDI|nr:PaREP1 family protein [Vulcanisaeta distributa]ADN50810.1 PaREP1 family protein [Vulcanisaeta distributa DSM 14429]
MSSNALSAMFMSALEVLNYAKEELDKALRLKDMLLYRNAADKAFLALIIAINAFIYGKTGVIPRNHGERRRILREIGREDLRALYSDLMRTLHDEAFYEGVYEPDEVSYAINKIENLIRELMSG